MSEYASREDLVLRFGELEINRLEKALTTNESVKSAIQDASNIADGYIGLKYPIPLPEVPENLKIYICDIARYLLWKTKASEEVRQRYEDAISFLERVSVGRGILTIKIINESGEEETAIADTSPKTMPIGTTYKGGGFSDSILDNMPSI